MKKVFGLFSFFSFSISFSQTFQNILIGSDWKPNEPAICISPTDTNKVFAAANINLIYYSVDGGKTWTSSHATSQYGVFGDPCIVADTAGNFLYFHLAKNDTVTVWPKWADRIVCQKTNNGGSTWLADSYAGYDPPFMQDKEWAAVDPQTNTIYVSWTEFAEYGSSLPTDSAQLFFSKSDDGGITWSIKKRIGNFTGDCLDSDSTIEGAMPAVGINGEVYECWAFDKKIYFNKSSDGGNTWLPDDLEVSNQFVGWDYEVQGIFRCNGLPVIQCDLSNSAYRGTIYINWTDKINGASDADVFISKSIDGGNTWSAPKRVNDDAAGKENFMSWMTIDQSSGNIYVLFYDRRNFDGDTTEVFFARSTDGGNTFTNYLLSQNYFVPRSNVFFGDYINISAVNGCVRPIWMRMDSNATSIYTALINFVDTIPSAVEIIDENSIGRLMTENPTQGKCVIAFENLSGDAFAELIDISGRTILRFENIAENHFLKFNLSELNLPAGIFLVRCFDTDKVQTIRVVFTG